MSKIIDATKLFKFKGTRKYVIPKGSVVIVQVESTKTDQEFDLMTHQLSGADLARTLRNHDVSVLLMKGEFDVKTLTEKDFEDMGYIKAPDPDCPPCA